ncbi:MAG: hypothetical protein ACRCY3_15815 [Sphingorhabdus sp.]
MTQPDCLLATLPLTDDALPYVWAVAEDRLLWAGVLDRFHEEYGELAIEDIATIAVVPASASTFRLYEARGLEPRQELAVAKLEAQQEAMGAVWVATGYAVDGRIMLATTDGANIEAALDRLAGLGLLAQAAIPAGSIVSPPDGEIWRIDLAGDTFLRSADLACPDEPGLRAMLFGAAETQVLGDAQLAQAIIAASRDPKPDFLEGRPRKRNAKPLFSDANRFWLGQLALLAALLVVASGIAWWGKLQWAISRENGAALAAAKTIDPSVDDIGRADAALDTALARKGAGGDRASLLAAIVWQSAKASENVTLNDLRVGKDGLLAATLAAPDAGSINAVLIAIQRAGYRITATPRRDPSGLTLVDLTVRAP